MPMWIPFWHLIWRSLVFFPQVLSQNWLSILFPVGLYLIREGIRIRVLYKQGGLRSMKWAAIKKDTKLLAFSYGLLFAWAVIHTVYVDHKDLQTRVLALSKKPADADVQLAYSIDGNHNGLYFAAVGINVRNTEGTARSFTDWNLAIESKSKNFPGHPVLMPRGGPSANYMGRKMFMKDDEYCPAAMSQLMPVGTSKFCWIWAIFDVSPSEVKKLDEPVSIVLRFRDLGPYHLYEVRTPLPKGDGIGISKYQ